MTLETYLEAIKQRWRLVLLGLVIGLLAGALFWAFNPPTYTASTKLYVASQPTSSTNSTYEGSLLSQERVKSYTELVNSSPVVNGVIAEQRLNEPPDRLADDIVATSAVDSVIIDVSVQQPSAVQASAVANAVAEQFTLLVNEIEKPVTGQPQSIYVKVVEPAEPPLNTSSLGFSSLVAFGAALGFLAGIVLAITRAVTDTTIRSADSLAQTSGLANIGNLRAHKDYQTRPILRGNALTSPRAEELRELRTNLQFVNIDSTRKIVAVTSALPGEGKTTTTLNLASTLAYGGFRVLVLDCDLRLPRVASALGVGSDVGVTSILTGRMSFEHAIQRWRPGNFDVLSSGVIPPNPSELLASRQMQALFHQAKSKFDYVLVDTPPILSVTDSAVISSQVDGYLLIAKYKKATRRTTRDSIETLQRASARVLGTVLTMAPFSSLRAGAYYGSYGGERAVPEADDQTNNTTKIKRPERRAREAGGLKAN